MSDEADDDVEYNQAMLAEEMAYRALHPHLLEKFLGKWVAIFEGELVDHDDDSVALYQRMRQKYPGKFVLMTPVQTEAVESYQIQPWSLEMQNVIQLPQEMYETVRKRALAQRKTTDDLVIEWVAEHLEEPTTNEDTQALDREVAAYEQLKPTLLEQYAGQYVAIYQGQVVASGTDKLALIDQVRQRLGPVVCYVEKVTPDSPRTVRMPSIRVVRS